MNRRAIPVGLLMACAIAISAAPARADAVTHWNVVAGNAALACGISPGANPLHESRMYAMTHLAVHDALNAIDSSDRTIAEYAADIWHAGPCPVS